MKLGLLFNELFSRWENAFDRAARESLRQSADDVVARGEFVSTTIIDQGAAGRLGDDRRNRTTARS
jgi:hypothetical protein